MEEGVELVEIHRKINELSRILDLQNTSYYKLQQRFVDAFDARGKKRGQSDTEIMEQREELLFAIVLRGDQSTLPQNNMTAGAIPVTTDAIAPNTRLDIQHSSAASQHAPTHNQATAASNDAPASMELSSNRSLPQQMAFSNASAAPSAPASSHHSVHAPPHVSPQGPNLLHMLRGSLKKRFDTLSAWSLQALAENGQLHRRAIEFRDANALLHEDNKKLFEINDRQLQTIAKLEAENTKLMAKK